MPASGVPAALPVPARVNRALGLGSYEQIVGFLYFGSRKGQAKNLPKREPGQYVSYWESPIE